MTGVKRGLGSGGVALERLFIVKEARKTHATRCASSHDSPH